MLRFEAAGDGAHLAAEPDERGAPRGLGRHAGTDVVVHVQLEMGLELLREPPIAASVVDESAEPGEQHAQRLHASPSAARKRARIAVVCAQSFDACSRRRWPARVSL